MWLYIKCILCNYRFEAGVMPAKLVCPNCGKVRLCCTEKKDDRPPEEVRHEGRA